MAGSALTQQAPGPNSAPCWGRPLFRWVLIAWVVLGWVGAFLSSFGWVGLYCSFRWCSLVAFHLLRAMCFFALGPAEISCPMTRKETTATLKLRRSLTKLKHFERRKLRTSRRLLSTPLQIYMEPKKPLNCADTTPFGELLSRMNLLDFRVSARVKGNNTQLKETTSNPKIGSWDTPKVGGVLLNPKACPKKTGPV